MLLCRPGLNLVIALRGTLGNEHVVAKSVAASST